MGARIDPERLSAPGAFIIRSHFSAGTMRRDASAQLKLTHYQTLGQGASPLNVGGRPFGVTSRVFRVCRRTRPAPTKARPETATACQGRGAGNVQHQYPDDAAGLYSIRRGTVRTRGLRCDRVRKRD
jgi:hypothetical protein